MSVNLGVLTHALSWLSAHPGLPTGPVGLTLYPDLNGHPAVNVNLETPEQVQAWAEALYATVEARPYKATTHHTFHVYEPFHVTVTAIVPDEATS